MKTTMPEQNFEHLIIYIALFKQQLCYFIHFQFCCFSNGAKIGFIKVPLAQKVEKISVPAFQDLK
jgi:hypothetical protein